MSTFTTWNGPQQYGPSMQNITQLITAYDNVSHRLEVVESGLRNVQGNYVNNSTFNSANGRLNVVEGNYVNNATFTAANIRLEQIESSYATDASVDAVKYNVSLLNTRVTAAEDIVNNCESNVSVLSGKVDNCESDIGIINTAIADTKSQIDNQFFTNDNNYTGFKQPLEVSKDIEYTEYALINANWVASPLIEGHGVYILGEVTPGTFFDEDGNDSIEQYKSCRVWLKYINSHPFDAIIDAVITQKGDNVFGDLKVQIVKAESDSWKGLKFVLAVGTDESGKQHVWLGINSTESYSRHLFDIAGINFTAGGTKPNGQVEVFAEANIPDDMVSGTAVSTVCPDVCYIKDIRIVDGELTIDGNITVNGNLTVEGGQLATKEDIQYAMPIGAGIRWGSENIPEGYLAAGTVFNTQEYPLLAEVYPSGVLPVEDSTIFLAKYR